MPRSPMYPEGSEQLNVIVPLPVKQSLVRLAGERRQSISQIVTVMLETALRDEEPEPVGAS